MKTMFAVPPGNVVVFEVALAINYDNEDGNIEADFESDMANSPRSSVAIAGKPFLTSADGEPLI